MNNGAISKGIVFLLFFLELYFFVYAPESNPLRNGLLFFLSSLFLGLVPLIFYKSIFVHSGHQQETKEGNNKTTFYIITGAMAVLSFVLFVRLINYYHVDPIFSDVIPSIQQLVDRFLNFQPVYATPLPFIGYEVPPTYLPMQWGPFVISQLLHIDHRLWAFIIFVFSVLLYWIFILRSEFSEWIKILMLSLPFIILYALMKFYPLDFVYSIETMTAGFYLILVYSFFSKSPFIKALALVLCLLSRFSLLLWIPLYFFILFIDSKKTSYQVAIYTFLGLSVLYFLPFLSEDWTSFFKGYKYYSKAASAEWGGQGWQAPGDQPYQLFRGLGMASYFYDFIHTELAAKLKALQYFHLVICLLTSAVLGWYYWLIKKRNQIMNVSIYTALSLKIYLAIFYAFIQVPYSYLFFVPVFVSIYIVALVFNRDSFETAHHKLSTTHQ